MQLTAHHVGLVVSDLDRTRAFYEALGFEVENVAMKDETRAIEFLRLGEFRLELFWYAEEPETLPAAAGKRIGFRHLALKTPDLAAVVAELKAAGVVPADAEIREVMGRYKLLFLNDPDGVEIELMEEADS